MTTDEQRQQAEIRAQWERWYQDSQDIVSRVIPGVFKTCEALTARAELAEASAADMFRQTTALHTKVADLEREVESLRGDRADLTASLERTVGEMARWCADMLVQLRADREALRADREARLLDHAQEGE